MKLEIRDLDLVRSVSAHGSLTAAAGLLHLTPSALSHRLRGIEDRLGVELFVRMRRRMVLTEAGRTLLAAAESVLGEIERVEGELAALAAGRSGTLRISAACYTSYPWLPGLVRGFSRLHPGIELQVLPECTGNVIAGLREGRLDVALVYSPVDDADLVARKFFEDEMVVLAAPSHPLARRAYVRPEDLEGSDVLLYHDDPRRSVFLAEVLGPAKVSPRRTYAVPMTEAIVELVKAGRGISFLANWAVAPFLKDGALVTIRMGRRGFRRRWSVVALSGSVAEGRLNDLATVLRKEVVPAPRRRPA